MSDGITDAHRGYHVPPKIKDMKIMICGASGTGKTTLANHISELHDLTLFSAGAKITWRKYGFKNHAQAIKESLLNPALGFNYQWDILRSRMKEAALHPTYITDRSYIDNLTYIMLQNGSQLCEDDILNFIELIKEGLEWVDLLIFLRFNDETVLEDDHRRIQNRYYQGMVDNTMSWVIHSVFPKLKDKVLEIDAWDFETRVKNINGWVNNL